MSDDCSASHDATGYDFSNARHQFLNRIRSLFNIDGWLLPELTAEQQQEFLRDPVRYFMGADRVQADAIFREAEKRQR